MWEPWTKNVLRPFSYTSMSRMRNLIREALTRRTKSHNAGRRCFYKYQISSFISTSLLSSLHLHCDRKSSISLRNLKKYEFLCPEGTASVKFLYQSDFSFLTSAHVKVRAPITGHRQRMLQVTFLT